jgi:hypothetical protein
MNESETRASRGDAGNAEKGREQRVVNNLSASAPPRLRVNLP